MFLFILHLPVLAQQGVTTFGLQVKPVVPLEFFDPLTAVSRDRLSGSIELTGGLAYGMLIRHGITKSISLETGINQIRRRYDLRITNDTSGYDGTGKLRWIGYEVPVTGLVFIRLGERSYMNTALGFSVDMYPSNAVVDIEEGRLFLFRNNWVQLGVVGNIGLEYRTEKSGIFYLGATYHRPFGPMSTADLTYYGPDFFPYTLRTDLSGSYLTVDLRYFFHEDPDRTRLRN